MTLFARSTRLDSNQKVRPQHLQGHAPHCELVQAGARSTTSDVVRKTALHLAACLRAGSHRKKWDRIVNAEPASTKFCFGWLAILGMRFCDLSGLRYEEIDWGARRRVGTALCDHGAERARAKTPAGTRLVYRTPSRCRRFESTSPRRRRIGLLFQTKLGTHLRARRRESLCSKAPVCEILGIPKATMHAFRHGRVKRAPRASW